MEDESLLCEKQTNEGLERLKGPEKFLSEKKRTLFSLMERKRMVTYIGALSGENVPAGGGVDRSVKSIALSCHSKIQILNRTRPGGALEAGGGEGF